MNMKRIFRFYNSLIRSSLTTVPYISTYMLYLCRHNLKNKMIMWLAVIISVCLAVEVLSYLSGGEINVNKKEEDIKTDRKASTVSTSSTNLAA